MPVAYFGQGEPTKELFNRQLVDSPPPVIAIDVETVSLKERMPLGFSIATSPDESWYFTVYPELDREIELVMPLLNNPKITKVFHNAIFDLRAFPLIGDIDTTNIWDTNVAARLLGRIETPLYLLAEEVDKPVTPAEALLGSRQTMLDLEPEVVAKHCAEDTRATLALYHEYLPHIDQEYFAVEMEVIPILIDMSLRGLKFSEQDRLVLEDMLEREVAYYRGICEAEDFNPASGMQAGYILAKRGNFLPFTKGKKQYRTNEETLEFLDDPLVAAILGFRRASKLLSTYIRPLAKQDRIYTEYNLDAVVGRVSSSNMNMQNIPGKNSPTGTDARHIFVPDSGTFTSGDYSQEHPRILAYVSQDREMLRVFDEGQDIHMKTAKELRVSRDTAKRVNNAMHGGATAQTVSINTKIKDLRVCSRFIDEWARLYKDAYEWIRGAQSEGIRTGWSLPTLFGRSVRIPEEYTKWGKLNEDGMKRKSSSYPILGSDGEIMKRALIICRRHNLPLALTVHDDIVCDGDIEFPIEDLENIAPVRIPFECKKTLRWE